MAAGREARYPGPSGFTTLFLICGMTGCLRSAHLLAAMLAPVESLFGCRRRRGSLDRQVLKARAVRQSASLLGRSGCASGQSAHRPRSWFRVGIERVAVSSLSSLRSHQEKTSLYSSRRILGIGRCCHSYRSARTRLHSLSVAMRIFYVKPRRWMKWRESMAGVATEPSWLCRRLLSSHFRLRFCLV